MSKFGRKIKTPPAGFETLEPTLTALENELRIKVNEPHEGLRKNESQWPIHQINWQKSRYVFDMYYTYGRIAREVYDYCISNKLVDAALIAKWKKPGYERLCSTYVINPRNYKFGTTSICRVPVHCLQEGTVIEDPTTGCRGCASGDNGNIFGNKYGQYLAAIQVAREERAAAKRAALEEQARAEQEGDADDDDDDDDEDDDSDGDDSKDGDDDSTSNSKGPATATATAVTSNTEEEPAATAYGSTASKRAASAAVWAANASEEEIAQPADLMGDAATAPSNPAAAAGSRGDKSGSSNGKQAGDHYGPPGKKARQY